ncbi:ABC transporter permease [Quadrisphaera sp. KR29]|uniref:ABC transporter permease n=1 Tax=Quadrisphaera sp. KR29 TaxID=3461391 RepID=UPI004043EE4F
MTTPPAGAPGRRGRRLGSELTASAGLLPFAALVVLFLVVPLAVVAVGALTDAQGRPSLGGLAAFGDPVVVSAFARSFQLSALTAVLGAVLGAAVAAVVAASPATSVLRRVVVAACGVLSQFAGVPLAFALIATIGLSGVLTGLLRDAGVDIYAGGVWLFEMPGLVLAYTFFQVPLMVIVFLPALDGVRSTWREASLTLGGTAWQHWRLVSVPVLAPAFTGSLLLLFANAMSAYATAAALVSQGSSIVPLQIRRALSSDVLIGQQDLASTLALGMVVVVALVMGAQAAVQRRTARWTR